jgi:hypothetical protein
MTPSPQRRAIGGSRSRMSSPVGQDAREPETTTKRDQVHHGDARHPPGATVARLRGAVLAAVKDEPSVAAEEAAILDAYCARCPSGASNGGSRGMAFRNIREASKKQQDDKEAPLSVPVGPAHVAGLKTLEFHAT